MLLIRTSIAVCLNLLLIQCNIFIHHIVWLHVNSTWNSILSSKSVCVCCVELLASWCRNQNQGNEKAPNETPVRWCGPKKSTKKMKQFVCNFTYLWKNMSNTTINNSNNHWNNKQPKYWNVQEITDDEMELEMKLNLYHLASTTAAGAAAASQRACILCVYIHLMYIWWLWGNESVTMIKFVNHLLNIWLHE